MLLWGIVTFTLIHCQSTILPRAIQRVGYENPTISLKSNTYKGGSSLTRSQGISEGQHDTGDAMDTSNSFEALASQEELSGREDDDSHFVDGEPENFPNDPLDQHDSNPVFPTKRGWGRPKKTKLKVKTLAKKIYNTRTKVSISEAM